MMEKNIFLTGFMGAGKSTIARKLQRFYGMQLIEMDEQIEQQEGMRISEIFAEKGEAYFRKLETELLEGMQQKKNTVVSCGGGVPMRDCNVEAMRKSGKIVYLDTSAAAIYHRVKDCHHRPLLEGNMNLDYISRLLEERLPKYLAAADVVISTDGKKADEICREIIERCEQ